MSLHTSSNSALIIAYRRKEQVHRIITILLEAGVNKIYLALDSVDGSDSVAHAESELLFNSLLELRKNSNFEILIAKHSENVGCSAAVLSACEWFFSNEEYGLVLEDDCIPSVDFVTFANSARIMIEQYPNLWVACGTQFAPSRLIEDSWCASRYALIWGWATSRTKWEVIFDSIKNPRRIDSSCLVNTIERQYWNAGLRRSSLGIVDAWDNVLVSQMIARGAQAILPHASLVSNVGYDLVATHTDSYSKWMNQDTASFVATDCVPRTNSQVDGWLKKNFYRISFRHLISTRITFVLDLVFCRAKRAISLKQRSNRASLNFLHY